MYHIHVLRVVDKANINFHSDMICMLANHVVMDL
jgi:hypothetical protein